jgi:hypothetical protein
MSRLCPIASLGMRAHRIQSPTKTRAAVAHRAWKAPQCCSRKSILCRSTGVRKALLLQDRESAHLRADDSSSAFLGPLHEPVTRENRSSSVKPDQSSHEVATGQRQHFEPDIGTDALKCRIHLRCSRFEYSVHGLDANTASFSWVAYIFR